MRVLPEPFKKGPKPTREKLNHIIQAVQESQVIPGTGLRIRETKKGIYLTLDDKILNLAGLSNRNQLGRSPGDGKNPFGSGTSQIDEKQPDPVEPVEYDWDDGTVYQRPPNTPSEPGGVNNPTTSPLRFVTLAVPAMLEDEEFSFQFQVIGGTTRNYQFSGGGQLPPGLEFFTFGTLVGTPTELGTYNWIVTVSDGDETISATFPLTVVDDGTLRLTAQGGSILPSHATWFDPFTPIPVNVRGGIAPFNVRQVGGVINPVKFVATSDTGGHIVANVPTELTISPFSGSGRLGDSWRRTLADQTLAAGQIPYSNSYPYRVDIGVTDSLGQNAITSVTVNISVDTGRYAVAHYNGRNGWFLRTFLEANEIPILF